MTATSAPAFSRSLPFVLLIVSFSLSTMTLRADPTTRPTVDQKALTEILPYAGELKDDVFTITVPRKDLNLTIEGNDVPTAAGIESRFHFYTCPCGKTRVIGEFVLADYESDDVIDALRDGALMHVDAVAPMFTDDRPRMRLVRFHGEGNADAVAERVKAALDCTAEARMQRKAK